MEVHKTKLLKSAVTIISASLFSGPVAGIIGSMGNELIKQVFQGASGAAANVLCNLATDYLKEFPIKKDWEKGHNYDIEKAVIEAIAKSLRTVCSIQSIVSLKERISNGVSYTERQIDEFDSFFKYWDGLLTDEKLALQALDKLFQGLDIPLHNFESLESNELWTYLSVIIFGAEPLSGVKSELEASFREIIPELFKRELLITLQLPEHHKAWVALQYALSYGMQKMMLNIQNDLEKLTDMQKSEFVEVKKNLDTQLGMLETYNCFTMNELRELNGTLKEMQANQDNFHNIILAKFSQGYDIAGLPPFSDQNPAIELKSKDGPMEKCSEDPGPDSLDTIKAAIEILNSNSPKLVPSVDPIVIAIETDIYSLAKILLPSERHLTISLAESDIERLIDLGKQIASLFDGQNRTTDWNNCKDILKCIGDQVYAVLVSVQPRLADIVHDIGEFNKPQPFAWVTAPDLLQKIELALAVITTPDSMHPYPFLCLSGADVYFSPLISDVNFQYRFPHRIERKLQCNLIQTDAALPHTKNGEVWKTKALSDFPLDELCSGDIICGHCYPSSEISQYIIEGIRTQSDTSPTRVVINLGTGTTPEGRIINDFIPLIPAFVGYVQAFEESYLNVSSLCRAIMNEIVRGLEIQSLPCIVGGVKRRLLTEALFEPVQRERHSLQIFFLSCWTHIGRPLFSKNYPGTESPAYPHLLDLRTIASEEWYYDRAASIPEQYQSHTLASLRQMSLAKECFHLYLTGDGGTGKSCFFQHVYNTLANQSDILAVWYRVDAPSSGWETIESRIKQLLEKSQAIQQYPEIQNIISKSREPLRILLPRLIHLLRRISQRFQIIIFIDQLERTFESGEKPELDRLKRISQQVRNLLEEVGNDQGVRIFLASRKQYLPDFAGSFLDLVKMNLHFYVLTNLHDSLERESFVKNIIAWCLKKKIINQDITISDEAARLIANKARGLPLDMVLSLIYLLSNHVSGIIDETLVNRLKPWSKLFEEDLQKFRIDRVDWYVMLAMAHAKTEIVKFDQVWWRLHLVDSDLSRRIQDLKQKGIIEKLWLWGKLGSTVYGRPDEQGNITYLEFFHANMRDYLLENEQAHMPLAWRALDRLADTSQEWEQNHRYLSQEDTHAVMENRATLLRYLPLLFVRELEEKRPGLVDAAKQCLCVSALIYKCYGRWLIQEIYPSPEERVEMAVQWLTSCHEGAQRHFIEFLIEENNEYAYKALADLILGYENQARENILEIVAIVLSSPIYSISYRIPFITYTLEHHCKLNLDGEGGEQIEIPLLLAEFIAMVATYDSKEVQDILYRCAHSFAASSLESNQRLAGYISKDPTLAANILKALPKDARRPRVMIEDNSMPMEFEPPMKLLLGIEMVTFLSQGEIDKWLEEIKEKWGIPLPPCFIFDGNKEELASNEIRFYINGVKVANRQIYPGREFVLEKHGTFYSSSEDEIPAKDPVEDEDGFWIHPEQRLLHGYEKYKSAGAVVKGWFEEIIRRFIEDIFDQRMVREFLLIAYGSDSTASREVFQRISPADLRKIIVNLIHEGVYLRSRQQACLERLMDFARFSKEPDILSERLRSVFGRIICTKHIDSEQVMYAVTLSNNIENVLDDSCKRTELGTIFLLSPLQVQELIETTAATLLRGQMAVGRYPVVLCSPRIRLPLYQLMERHLPQITIISYSELITDIRVEAVDTVVEDSDIFHSSADMEDRFQQ